MNKFVDYTPNWEGVFGHRGYVFQADGLILSHCCSPEFEWVVLPEVVDGREGSTVVSGVTIHDGDWDAIFNSGLLTFC